MVRIEGCALDEHLLFVQYSELAVSSIGTVEQFGPVGGNRGQIPALSVRTVIEGAAITVIDGVAA